LALFKGNGWPLFFRLNLAGGGLLASSFQAETAPIDPGLSRDPIGALVPKGWYLRGKLA
jgi:hypothetical protein